MKKLNAEKLTSLAGGSGPAWLDCDAILNETIFTSYTDLWIIYMNCKKYYPG